MILDIARHELRGYSRSGVFIGLSIALLALLLTASIVSGQRFAAFERERIAAEIIDREVWNNQGEQNPHSAAHFSRYAFKPIPSLVAFDPGVVDYAGIALWMEAHYQHPAVFRRVEDVGDARVFASFSPAWILQYGAPLFVFLTLFSSIAGEREHGTLRQIVASGVRARDLVAGKLLGAFLGLGAILIPALILSIMMVHVGGVQVLPDIGVRSLGLVIAYCVYLTAVGGIAIGVSTLARDKRTALVALVAIWSISFLILPRFAVGSASTLFPTPEAETLAKERDAASDDWWYGDEKRREEVKRSVLEEYGVADIKDLPFNYGGFMLQYSEEDANIGFDKIYGRLSETYERQEGVLDAISVLSPVFAIKALSSGLAGTDRIHHQAFSGAAEAHRRVIVKQLNDDLMYNAAPGGYESTYSAGKDLWAQIEDFEHTPPPFAAVLSSYLFNAFVLLVYAAAGVYFARCAMRRVQKGIAE